MSDLIKKTIISTVLFMGGPTNPVWRADTTNITADQTGPTADGAQ